jgi:hypothetical protein
VEYDPTATKSVWHLMFGCHPFRIIVLGRRARYIIGMYELKWYWSIMFIREQKAKRMSGLARAGGNIDPCFNEKYSNTVRKITYITEMYIPHM